MAEIATNIKSDFARFNIAARKQFPVKDILLYGSYAKGLATKDSDIDMAVVMDRVPEKTKMEITIALYRIALQINPIIEPKCIYWDEYLNPEPASILAEIIRTAVKV